MKSISRVCPKCRKKPEVISAGFHTVIRCPDRRCRLTHNTGVAEDTVIDAVNKWNRIWKAFYHNNWITRYRECPACEGSGKVVKRDSEETDLPCGYCHGRGFVILSELESCQMNIVDSLTGFEDEEKNES